MTEVDIKELVRLQSELTAALAAWKTSGSTYIDLVRFEKCQLSFEKAIISSAHELIKDALRYNHVRQWVWNSSSYCVVADPKAWCKLGSFCPSHNLLDEIVDEELSGKENS